MFRISLLLALIGLWQGCKAAVKSVREIKCSKTLSTAQNRLQMDIRSSDILRLTLRENHGEDFLIISPTVAIQDQYGKKDVQLTYDPLQLDERETIDEAKAKNRRRVDFARATTYDLEIGTLELKPKYVGQGKRKVFVENGVYTIIIGSDYYTDKSAKPTDCYIEANLKN